MADGVATTAAPFVQQTWVGMSADNSKQIKQIRRLVISTIVLGAFLGLAACDQGEDSRPLNYKPGVYQGTPVSPLSDETLEELRRRAEKALGTGFDIREFHDAVLLNGSVPLPVLEEQIDRFIAEHGGAG